MLRPMPQSKRTNRRRSIPEWYRLQRQHQLTPTPCRRTRKGKVPRAKHPKPKEADTRAVNRTEAQISVEVDHEGSTSQGAVVLVRAPPSNMTGHPETEGKDTRAEAKSDPNQRLTVQAGHVTAAAKHGTQERSVGQLTKLVEIVARWATLVQSAEAQHNRHLHRT